MNVTLAGKRGACTGVSIFGWHCSIVNRAKRVFEGLAPSPAFREALGGLGLVRAGLDHFSPGYFRNRVRTPHLPTPETASGARRSEHAMPRASRGAASGVVADYPMSIRVRNAHPTRAGLPNTKSHREPLAARKDKCRGTISLFNGRSDARLLRHKKRSFP